ncbi:MAG: SDR family oxidoreductase [Alphaproteobacteria bacterium]|nr:SDR family oxidoreductase [Alphaproteobacteria bacterium]
MRVFVTGATGFIGSAVVKELLAAGHSVLGLARSDATAKTLAATGAAVHRGELADLEGLKSGAAQCDGVIHTAFIHDFSKFAENAAIDKAAIEAMGAILAGSNRPLIVSSGTAGLAVGQVATEDMPPPTMSPRASETAVFSFTGQGVRTMAIRLSPAVHGYSDQGFKAGFASVMLGAARQKGVSPYPGDGKNRWNAVHVSDAARLYRLALENGKAGSRYHAVGDESIPVKDIAEAIGKKLNLPVTSIAPDKTAEHFGFLAMFVGLDIPASSAKTQAELNWTPTGIGLLADIEQATSFAGV